LSLEIFLAIVSECGSPVFGDPGTEDVDDGIGDVFFDDRSINAIALNRSGMLDQDLHDLLGRSRRRLGSTLGGGARESARLATSTAATGCTGGTIVYGSVANVARFVLNFFTASSKTSSIRH